MAEQLTWHRALVPRGPEGKEGGEAYIALAVCVTLYGSYWRFVRGRGGAQARRECIDRVRSPKSGTGPCKKKGSGHNQKQARISSPRLCKRKPLGHVAMAFAERGKIRGDGGWERVPRVAWAPAACGNCASPQSLR